MESYVAQKLNDYATGKLSRRGLIEMLTFAATTAYATGANAQSAPGLKAALVNHVSYTTPDFKKAADWYSKAFNIDQVGMTNRDVALPFGKKGDKPLGVTANDVPLTHLIIRSRDNNAPAANAAPRPQPTASIDHVCYTIADFDREKVKTELTALGCTNVRNNGQASVMAVDPFGGEIQLSGIESTALSGGG
jgi:hypothetical protein